MGDGCVQAHNLAPGRNETSDTQLDEEGDDEEGGEFIYVEDGDGYIWRKTV